MNSLIQSRQWMVKLWLSHSLARTVGTTMLARGNQPSTANTMINTPSSRFAKLCQLLRLNFFAGVIVAAACSFAATSIGFAQATPPAQTTNEDDNTVLLSPFKVTTEQNESGYSGQQTLAGSRSSQSLIELPTNIAIINKQLIDDLAASDVQGVLKFGVSGVTQNQTINDDVNIRGFRSIGSLRNGISYTSSFSTPLYDTARVEVIKGPAAMVLGSGSGSIGGVLNFVTIAPTATRSSDIHITVSENNYVRFTANTKGPVYKSKDFTALYRLTVGLTKGDNDKEIEKLDDKYLGGAVSLQFGGKTSISVTGFLLKDKSYRYWNDFLDVTGPAPTINNLRTARLNTYSGKSFSPFRSKYAYNDITAFAFDVTILTKLTDNSDLRFVYLQDKYIITGLASRGITVQADNYTLNRQVIPFETRNQKHVLQFDYKHNLALKHVTFDTSMGAELGRQDAGGPINVTTAPPLDTRNPNYSADDIFLSNPLPGRGLPYTANTSFESHSKSYYIQENVSFWNKRLTLVGGLRWFTPSGSNFNHITGTVTARDETKTQVHKYGAVVRVLPWLSAYYTDAQNVNVQTGPTDRFALGDRLGPPLKNQLGINQEVGLKMEHRVSEAVSMYGTFARFDMALTNVRTFGDLGNGQIGVIQTEKDSAKGWELDYGLQIKTRQGRVDAVATYFDGNSNIATDKTVQADGFVPKKFSIMARYTLLSGTLKGLTIGAAYENQTGKRNRNYFLLGSDVLNLFGRYQVNRSLSVQLNLDNVMDKRPIVAALTDGLVQTGYAFRSSLTVKYSW